MRVCVCVCDCARVCVCVKGGGGMRGVHMVRNRIGMVMGWGVRELRQRWHREPQLRLTRRCSGRCLAAVPMYHATF